MDFLTLNGGRKNLPVKPYLVDWDSKTLSKFQRGVKDFLRPYWASKVVLEEMPCAGRLRIDLVNINDRIAVETQGEQHSGPHFYHGGSLAKFRDQLKRDIRKAEWCEKNGFALVEILPEDLPLTPAFFLDRYGITL